MKTESTDGALPAPAEELRRELWERCRQLLVPLLRRRLQFADVEAVARLVEKQFNHTRFLPEESGSLLPEPPAKGAGREAWLEAKAREFCAGVAAVKGAGDSERVVAAVCVEGARGLPPEGGVPESGHVVVAACVEDCDRVAEYLLAKTSRDRRQEIRGFYWNAYRVWVANTLLRMFRECSPLMSSDDPSLQEAQAWVEDRAFAEARFGKTLAGYKTGEGKTFASFLEFLLAGRCRDARKKFASEADAGRMPAPHFSSGDAPEGETGLEDLAGQEASGPEPGPRESASQRLERCLSALRGPEERAVVELRYRAHVNPKLMAPRTLERAARAASLRELEKEFDADQQALRRLQDEEIPEREAEQRQAFGRSERKQAELEMQGWPRERINELKHPRGSRIEPLQAEMKDPAATSERRQELEFQIACVRRQKASNRLLEARDRLTRYQRAQHPWVRSQEEIARLLGMDQVTVCRRLKSALMAMRQWRLSCPPLEEQSPDDK